MSVVDRVSQHAVSTTHGFEPFGAARRAGVQVADPDAFLRKKMPALRKWLGALLCRGYINEYVTLRDHTERKGGATSVAISIWSEKYEFVISATLPEPGKMRKICHRTPRSGRLRTRNVPDGGYLGCGLVCRAPYAGEQHRRARDLYDGAYDEQTWKGILGDILTNCLVPLHSWARPERSKKRRGRRKTAR